MRVIRITRPGGPEVLELADAPTPRPGPGEVLVRVQAAGVNRADILQREGRYPAPAGAPPDIPGLEYAGTVAALGASVAGWEVGERVMGIVAGGAYAEYLVAAADHLLRVPRHWSDATAAAVPEAFLTAHDALERAALQSGEHCLVHAAGSGVGIALVQLAAVRGSVPAGTSRSPWKLERAREYGLEIAVPVSGGFEPPAWLREWADVVCDLVGGAYLAGNLAAARSGCRMVVIGLMGGRTSEIDLGIVLRKRVTLIGTVLRSRSAAEKAALVSRFTSDVLPLSERHAVRPVLDRTFPMTEADRAHRHIEESRNFGSVVLTWD